MKLGSRSRREPARLPPPGLPGLDPRWSRLVTVPDADGVERTFHLLDSWAAGQSAEGQSTTEPVGTLLCVHGNPTWSYLWRRMLASAPPGWRVIAPDQLGMGFSERLDRPRSLSGRVDDLVRLTDALGVSGAGRGSVVTLAHDWGGVISLGWALRHPGQVRGVVLTNTAVHQPRPGRGPLLIRLAHLRLVNRVACRWTPLFVRATTSLTWPRLPRDVRNAFALPYSTARRRIPVADFVLDIPFAPGHDSNADVESIAAGVAELTVPALFLWGPRDPVFSDVYLRDLQDRLPQAVLHRYETASHLLPEDAPGYADAVAAWLAQLHLGSPAGTTSAVPAPSGPDRAAAPELITTPDLTTPDLTPPDLTTPDLSTPDLTTPDLSTPEWVSVPELVTGPGLVTAPQLVTGQGRPDGRSVLAQLEARAQDDSPAVAEVGGDGITWRELNVRVRHIAAGFTANGLRAGQRVALLIPPSIDLTVAMYAVWRAGGVVVVADKGLGLRGMGRALRGARLDALIADTAGLLAARAMRLPGRRFALRENTGLIRRAGRVEATLPAMALAGGGRPVAADAVGDDEAAVLFTSGATGPAKGVLYLHRQVRAQIALIRSTYALTPDDRIVAAFAPFALYGPALGIRSVVPRVDVTQPGRLTAAALADAAQTVGATVVFASPAALRNVVRTADALSAEQRSALAGIRLLMSAGASVPASLLLRVREVLPAADLRTPYGMTEALPLTDVSLDQILEAGPGEGVCVGRPLPGVQIGIAALGRDGEPAVDLSTEPGITGEIWACAPHIRQRYDASWVVDQAARAHPGWHRTGDIGHLDAGGRLWIEGRAVHVITTSSGPVTPVGIEVRVESRLAAVPPQPAGTPTRPAEVPSVGGVDAGEPAVGAHPAEVPSADGVYAGAAAVGVGPAGTQQVVVVLEGPGEPLAPDGVTRLVRRAAGVEIAAVLVMRKLPVDIRHNSKIDRAAVGRWAAGVLAGG